MIAKGTTHNNGAKLARYMTTGKDGERAELWQLYGFGSNDIKEAFRSVHVMAEATKCEQPFFHVQVRNREGETLTRQQWEATTHRIMRVNGLTGQPYAIAFHRDELTGDEHMHLAVSLIDGEHLKAKRLPFFKGRLKIISRELETEFGLEPVTNEREGPIKYAPTRAQDQQARRLGVDLHYVRNTIRTSWDHSDNGRSFEAALAEEGLILAQGDRRGLVVIDREGGIHALGKRILDVTPGQMKARMSDLPREELPSVNEVRAFVVELIAEKQHGKPAPEWDRESTTVRDEIQWQDALDKAAIAKEKTERQFVEPRDDEKEKPRAGREQKEPGSREERHGPVNPQQAEERERQGPAQTRDRLQDEIRFTPITGNDASIVVDQYEDFFALGTVASAKVEAQMRQQWEKRQAQRETQNTPPAVTRSGPDVWMAQRGGYDALSPELKAKAEKDFDHWKNHGRGTGTSYNIHAYVSYAQQRWAERPPPDFREANADAKGTLFLKGIGRELTAPATRVLNTAARVINQAPVRMAGKILDVFARAAEGLLAPPVLTPEQRYEAEKSASRREAEAEATLDYSRYTADATLERRQQENDREAERQRQRDGRER